MPRPEEPGQNPIDIAGEKLDELLARSGNHPLAVGEAFEALQTAVLAETTDERRSLRSLLIRARAHESLCMRNGKTETAFVLFGVQVGLRCAVKAVDQTGNRLTTPAPGLRRRRG